MTSIVDRFSCAQGEHPPPMSWSGVFILWACPLCCQLMDNWRHPYRRALHDWGSDALAGAAVGSG